MPSDEQDDTSSSDGAVTAPVSATSDPGTIDAVLDEIGRAFSRSVLSGEGIDEWQERLGRMIGRYQRLHPDADDLVFRVDRMMVEHGSPPWSIERRGSGLRTVVRRTKR